MRLAVTIRRRRFDAEQPGSGQFAGHAVERRGRVAHHFLVDAAALQRELLETGRHEIGIAERVAAGLARLLHREALHELVVDVQHEQVHARGRRGPRQGAHLAVGIQIAHALAGRQARD